MSNEQAKKIEHAFGWLTQTALIALTSACLYFLQDMHSDFKRNQQTVESHEVRISVLEARIK